MKIYHTSPEAITEIKENQGPFGGALFFASTPYAMNNVKCTYSIELDESQVIEVCSLDDEEVVEEIVDMANRFFDIELDEDDAYDILCGHETIWDLAEGQDAEDLAEFDWTVQGLQAKAAQKAGYLAAESIDEQGTVYIINMIGKESLLKLEEVA